MGSGSWERPQRVWGKQTSNQYHQIKLWPLSPHQTTRMNLQKTKKSGKIETKWWYSKNLETYLHVLLSNCLVPGCCTFSRLRNLLPKPFFVHQSSPSLYVFQVPLLYASFQMIISCPPYACFQSLSSMPLFQTILSCVPLLCVFRVPLFYASLPVPKKKSLYSYQPLKLNLLKRIHFPFFYFPSFFKNQDAPLFSCRIFSFHMYAATLIPFSSQNISLTFLSAHTLVRVE